MGNVSRTRNMWKQKHNEKLNSRGGGTKKEGELVLVLVLVVQMIHDTASLSWRVRMMHLIRVAEHLGASSRRPRHPFPALMTGEPLAVYLCTRPKKPRSCTTGTSTTATLALQLELEVVVVVSAKNANAAEPAFSMPNTQRPLGTGKNRRGISNIGLTLSQTES